MEKVENRQQRRKRRVGGRGKREITDFSQCKCIGQQTSLRYIIVLVGLLVCLSLYCSRPVFLVHFRMEIAVRQFPGTGLYHWEGVG